MSEERAGWESGLRTNVDGLDADALLDVGGLWVVVDLVCEHAGLAEGVDECGATGAGCAWTASERAGSGARQRADRPTTMTVNWTPFFTPFFLVAIFAVGV